jgi:hypothetical protein
MSEIQIGYYRSFHNIAPGIGRVVLIRDFRGMDGIRVHVVGNQKELATYNVNLLGPWLQVNTIKPIVMGTQSVGYVEAIEALSKGLCVKKACATSSPVLYAPFVFNTFDDAYRSIYEIDIRCAGHYVPVDFAIKALNDRFFVEEI